MFPPCFLRGSSCPLSTQQLELNSAVQNGSEFLDFRLPLPLQCAAKLFCAIPAPDLWSVCELQADNKKGSIQNLFCTLLCPFASWLSPRGLRVQAVSPKLQSGDLPLCLQVSSALLQRCGIAPSAACGNSLTATIKICKAALAKPGLAKSNCLRKALSGPFHPRYSAEFMVARIFRKFKAKAIFCRKKVLIWWLLPCQTAGTIIGNKYQFDDWHRDNAGLLRCKLNGW